MRRLAAIGRTERVARIGFAEGIKIMKVRGPIREFAAEGLGAMLLALAATGAGIVAEQEPGTGPVLVLLFSGAVTGAMLCILSAMFAPVSGAHFNPAVTFAWVLFQRLSLRKAAGYMILQIAGAIAGVMCAHFMFGMDMIQNGAAHYTRVHHWLGEVAATFIFILAALTPLVRGWRQGFCFIVGLAIAAIYWFSPTHSFANPALTISRTLTSTFNGLHPADAPALLLMQIIAVLLAAALIRWLFAATGADELSRSTFGQK